MPCLILPLFCVRWRCRRCITLPPPTSLRRVCRAGWWPTCAEPQQRYASSIWWKLCRVTYDVNFSSLNTSTHVTSLYFLRFQCFGLFSICPCWCHFLHACVSVRASTVNVRAFLFAVSSRRVSPSVRPSLLQRHFPHYWQSVPHRVCVCRTVQCVWSSVACGHEDCARPQNGMSFYSQVCSLLSKTCSLHTVKINPKVSNTLSNLSHLKNMKRAYWTHYAVINENDCTCRFNIFIPRAKQPLAVGS